MKVDRVRSGLDLGDLGRRLMGKMNGVVAHKMRWVKKMAVDKKYGTLVLCLDRREEVEKLLRTGLVEISGRGVC